MNKNIVFFDIDGTLIDEKTHKVPYSTIEAIKKLRENGNLAFINTGRPISFLPTVLKEINFDGVICGCGTYIEYNNQVLFYRSLGKDLSRNLVTDLRHFNLDGILEGRNGIYFDLDENIKAKEIFDILDIQTSEDGFIRLSWDDENIEVDKFIIFKRDDSNYKDFYEKYKNVFEFIDRGSNLYEIIPLGCSKATGIKFIIDKLEIPHENTYAIGDSTNDLSMLEYVDNSIAMGNSTPILFNLVTYITSDVSENGISNALKHYGMI